MSTTFGSDLIRGKFTRRTLNSLFGGNCNCGCALTPPLSGFNYSGTPFGLKTLAAAMPFQNYFYGFGTGSYVSDYTGLVTTQVPHDYTSTSPNYGGTGYDAGALTSTNVITGTPYSAPSTANFGTRYRTKTTAVTSSGAWETGSSSLVQTYDDGFTLSSAGVLQAPALNTISSSGSFVCTQADGTVEAATAYSTILSADISLFIPISSNATYTETINYSETGGVAPGPLYITAYETDFLYLKTSQTWTDTTLTTVVEMKEFASYQYQLEEWCAYNDPSSGVFTVVGPYTYNFTIGNPNSSRAGTTVQTVTTVVTLSNPVAVTDVDTAAQEILDACDFFNTALYFNVFDEPKVFLQWSPTTGASTYHVKRNGTTIYTGNVTSYTDAGIVTPNNYTYTISAVVSGVETADSTGAAITAALPTSPTTTTPVSFPAAPATTPSAGAPLNLSATFYNSQYQQQYSTILTQINPTAIIAFPLTSGFCVSRNVAFADAAYLCGNRQIAGLTTYSAAANVLFYAQSLGFLTAPVLNATTHTVSPRKFYYTHESLDGSAGAVDDTSLFTAVTFPNGWGLGYLFYLSDELDFYPSDVPGHGELFYAS